MQAAVADLSHPVTKALHIVDALGLNKIGAGVNLLLQADDAELKGVRKRIGCCTDEHSRFFNFGLFRVFDLLAGGEDFFIPHIFYHLNQLYRIKVKNMLGSGMVAETLMVAGQAEDIANAEKICA